MADEVADWLGIINALEEVTPEGGIIRLEKWGDNDAIEYVLWYHGEIVWRSMRDTRVEVVNSAQNGYDPETGLTVKHQRLPTAAELEAHRAAMTPEQKAGSDKLWAEAIIPAFKAWW